MGSTLIGQGLRQRGFTICARHDRELDGLGVSGPRFEKM